MNRLLDGRTWQFASIAALLLACNDGGSSIETSAEGSGSPAYDGPVGDNGAFQFTPEDPGAYPGAYVVAETAGGELRTSSVEVLLTEYDAPVRIERALELPGFEPSDVPFAIPEPTELGPERIQPARATLELDRPHPADPISREEQVASRFAEQVQALLEGGAAPQNKADCNGRVPGQFYDSMGLFAGYHFWIGANFDIEQAGQTISYAWVHHFTPEGRYVSLQSAAGVSLPGSLAGLGISTGWGFIQPPAAGMSTTNPSEMAVGTLAGISISVSTSIGFVSVGFSLFLDGSTRLFHRALQLDAGFGMSADLIGGALPIGVGVANTIFATTTGSGEPAALFVSGWSGPCPDANKEMRFVRQGQEARAQALTDLAALVDESAARSDGTFEGVLRSEGARAAQPLVASLANAGGNPPAEGIAASTNGAWMAEFLASDPDGVCTTCPSTSIDGLIADTLVRLQMAGEDTGAVTVAGFQSVNQLLGSWPSPSQYDDLAERSLGMVDTAFAQAFETAAELRGDTNRFVDQSVVEIDAQAGVPFEFRIPTEEIAALLDGYDVADVVGATVCVLADFSGPRLEDQCGELSENGIGGAMTLEDTTRMLVALSVDLTTAAGDFPDDVDTWTVRPALRLITTRSGPAENLELVAPASVFSGAPVTLTATLTDAANNVADESATYTFYDPFGEVIDTVTTDTGYASIQFTPSPVTPVVESFEATTVTIGDAEVQGYGIVGQGLSGYATVTINGEDMTRYGLELARSSSERIALIPAEPDPDAESPPIAVPTGDVTVEFINPGGLSSGPFNAQL